MIDFINSSLEGEFALFEKSFFSCLFRGLQRLLVFIQSSSNSSSLLWAEINWLVFLALNEYNDRKGHMNGTAIDIRYKIKNK